MQAVVLAAGKGQRLWPLTEHRPKPMVPVANRPLLEHIIDELDSAGVTEVVLVVGSNRNRVQSHFGDGRGWNLNISYVVQESQLGTGHALLEAEALAEDSFVALNGDRVIDAEVVSDVWARHKETERPVLSVTRSDRPSQYGVVEIDGEIVTDLEEQPLPKFAKSDFINAGVYGFDSSIFAAIQQTESYGEQALTDTLSDLVADRQVHAVRYTGRWLDVSEPWDLLQVNDALVTADGSQRDLAGVDASAVIADETVLSEGVVMYPNASVLGDVSLGENVTIGANSVVENSILLPGATIESGVVMRDCIVGANTTVGPNATVTGGNTDIVLDSEVYEDVTLGALVGDNVTIGANVTVNSGTIIGNNVAIDSAAVLSGRVADGSHVHRG